MASANGAWNGATDPVLPRLLAPASWLGADQGGYFQMVPFQCKSKVLGLEVE